MRLTRQSAFDPGGNSVRRCIKTVDEQQIKKENLEQTIENLRYRFGRSAINRAVVLREKKFAELDIKDSHSGNSLGKKN